MKLATLWLEKFLSLDEVTPEEVASKLTMGSFEVEEIYKRGLKLRGPIIVGKILDIQKHPNADKLSVTKVTTDSKNELVIVCGAKNIEVGQLVPVSLQGATVINRTDGSELVIKATKIRGIESAGMLCSPTELGIATDDSDGIFILGIDAKVGQDVIDYLSLNKNVVLEIASRSNRGDALSVYGLSKEISALTKKKRKEISFKEPKFDKSVQIVTSKIESTKDTYVFYTATIEDILVTESPNWLKNLLNSVGIRSINNIVDITNYINFSFGQPLHAYDREKLRGRYLISRFAKDSEKITTIDGKTRELREGVLVIADEVTPVAISGIMGGKDSEVTEATKNIVLEAAVFNPAKIRKGSRTMGLSSEASKRFERGVDSTFTYNALLKAIELVEELATLQNKKPKAGEIYQSGEPVKKEIKIKLSINEVKRVLGIGLKVNEIAELLESLGFNTKIITEDTLEALVPFSRTNDVTRPIDLIEEVARIYGYDHIPPEPPQATLCADRLTKSLEKAKNHFLAAGFSEACLSSLIGEQIINNKDFTFDKTKAVEMMNPLSKEHSSLRQFLLPSLLETIKLNQSHKTNAIRLFEIGKTYFLNSHIRSDKETGVCETLKLAGVVSGFEENWNTNKNLHEQTSKNLLEYLFFTTKGILEGFFRKDNLQIDFENTIEKFLHPSYALKIKSHNNEFGFVGSLHPNSEKRMELKGPVIIFEFNLEPLLLELEKVKTFEKISSQPAVERDITIDVHKKHSAKDIFGEIKKTASTFIVSINLISVYELDKENRSLTYRLKMQDFDQTLTSKQVEDEVNKIKNHLAYCFQAKFRV